MTSARARELRAMQGLMSEATRAKLAEAKRRNWADPEYRARQSAAVRRGKANSYRRIVDLP